MALPPRASGPYRPTRLGQWEVIAKIAGGGMSAVYLGRQADAPPDVTNVVALKIARHDTSMDERLVKMFLDEGKLIQRLVHPNIVRVLEVGADADQDFIAMELMLGKTFAGVHDTIAARGLRMSPDIAVWCAARTADALHFAHELTDENGRALKLVHRDVNPANIFATFRGEVKLFDFGLAKVSSGDTGASSQHMLAGKLSYLSPEQVMQIPVDRRSDIFSLGTTLWELLTGKRLFRRESDIDTVRAVQLGPIPDIRQIGPELPEDLSRIVKTALERNRDHRYPTAAYLARDLDAWLYKRTSPQDVMQRLAQLVDTLFPGEQKRQGGWLKPAITSVAGTRSQLGTLSPPALTSRPPKPNVDLVRRDTRETTAVMENAPGHTMSGNTPTEGVHALEPGPLTPREGVPSLPPSMPPLPPSMPPLPPSMPPVPSSTPSVPPATPRFGSTSPRPSQAPSTPSRSWGPPRRPPIATPPPISRTDPGLPDLTEPELPWDSADPPTDVTTPRAQADIDFESAIDAAIESTIVSENPPIPPPAKTPSIAAPTKRPSLAPSQPPAKTKPPTPAPKPTASRIPAPTATGRMKRAPIPLPSKVPRASVPPKPSVAPPPPKESKPPDSKTQIDVPTPERKR